MGSLQLYEASDKKKEDKRLQLLDPFDVPSERAWHREGYPFPEGVFAAILCCTNASCRERIAVSGVWETSEDYTEEGDSFSVSEFIPRMFTPPLHIFKIPSKTPKTIHKEVVAAFNVFWCDTASCLNRIRTAVEQFLTHMKVARKTPSGGFVSLDSKITQYKAKEPELGNHMMAVKWLGNAGSHPSKVSPKDALDGFDLLEHILTAKFSHIHAVSQTINRTKGPRKHRKRIR
jgi:hypothetical protein